MEKIIHIENRTKTTPIHDWKTKQPISNIIISRVIAQGLDSAFCYVETNRRAVTTGKALSDWSVGFMAPTALLSTVHERPIICRPCLKW